METKRKRVVVPKPGTQNRQRAQNAEGGKRDKALPDAELERSPEGIGSWAAKRCGGGAREAEDEERRAVEEREREEERARRRAEAEAKEREEREREEALKAKEVEDARRTGRRGGAPQRAPAAEPVAAEATRRRQAGARRRPSGIATPVRAQGRRRP